jgi:hypothetical protein
VPRRGPVQDRSSVRGGARPRRPRGDGRREGVGEHHAAQPGPTTRDDQQPRPRFRRARVHLDFERPAADVDPTPVEEPEPDRRRLASLFEPAAADPAPAQAPPVDAGRWSAATAAAGMAAGRPGGDPRGWAPARVRPGAARADGELSSVTATRASATRPPAAPVISIVVRPTASPACRETVTRADQLIDLLVRNRRSAAADLLVAYTVASRQCRRDASP